MEFDVVIVEIFMIMLDGLLVIEIMIVVEIIVENMFCDVVRWEGYGFDGYFKRFMFEEELKIEVFLSGGVLELKFMIKDVYDIYFEKYFDGNEDKVLRMVID